MIPVRHDAVEVDFGTARASLRVRDLSAFDDHDLANSLTQGLGLPANPAAMPPTPSFLSTGATIRWSAEQPGFRFESDAPPDPNANLISVLGRERNGVFFS